MASATPSQRSQRWWRKWTVFSQSIAVSSQGSVSASGSATTCAAANAMRLKFFVAALEGKMIGSPVVYDSSLRSAVGRTSVAKRSSLNLDIPHVQPATLFPAFQTQFGKLNAFYALDQTMMPWSVGDDMTDEIFPLQLEAILIDDVLRHFLPLRLEVHGLGDVWIPHRPRRVHAMLGPAFGQTGDGRAM